MEPLSDLEIFFSDFGVPAVIKQPGQPDISTTVLFDQHNLVEIGVNTERPTITLPTMNLTGLDLTATTITVIGKYPESRIIKPFDDGYGLTLANLAQV